MRRGGTGRTRTSRLAGSLGYWRDPVGTAERFRSRATGANVPGAAGACGVVRLTSSGGTRRDSCTFVGRRDDMIKTSGLPAQPDRSRGRGLCDWPGGGRGRHRSPACATGSRDRACVSAPRGSSPIRTRCWRLCGVGCRAIWCRWRWTGATLPRNATGKFDRQRLRHELAERFADIELALPATLPIAPAIQS